MIIRPFETSDFPAILDIYASSKLDELVYENRVFELLPLDKDKKRLAELQESDIYVLDDNGVVGYGALFGSDIRALFVHPKGRGRGLGKILMEALLAKVSGEACLYVAKTNHPAQSLYQQFGFNVVDEFETSYNGVSVLANKMVRAESYG